MTVALMTSQDLLPEEPPLGRSEKMHPGTSVLLIGLYVLRKAGDQVFCPVDCPPRRLGHFLSLPQGQSEPPLNNIK